MALRGMPADKPVATRPDPKALYGRRAAQYVRFVRMMFYPQGVRAYFDRAEWLHAGMRCLDAGCGTGIATLALIKACAHRRLPPGRCCAFDLTPGMLERFRREIPSAVAVELAEGDVLRLSDLPPDWTGFDVVICASMLEYVPRSRLVDALSGLRARLADDGTFVLFISRRNPLMRWLIGRWWHAELYSRAELEQRLAAAGYTRWQFRRFPFPYTFLSLWGHVVEAQR